MKQTLENKVPAITMIFWLAKLISTMLGESASDFSTQLFGQTNQTLGELFTVGWSFSLFLIFLSLQMHTNKYQPIFYWNSVGLLAVFGTFSADTSNHSRVFITWNNVNLCCSVDHLLCGMVHHHKRPVYPPNYFRNARNFLLADSRCYLHVGNSCWRLACNV